jgi:hypothetical protein
MSAAAVLCREDRIRTVHQIIEPLPDRATVRRYGYTRRRTHMVEHVHDGWQPLIRADGAGSDAQLLRERGEPTRMPAALAAGRASVEVTGYSLGKLGGWQPAPPPVGPGGGPTQFAGDDGNSETKFEIAAVPGFRTVGRGR